MEVLRHFTNRYGGVSKEPYKSNNLALHVNDKKEDVQANRNLTCKTLCIKNLQTMNQVHQDTICVINSLCLPPQCDALITNKPNIALMVLIADCIPLLLHDTKNSVIAAVHAGRAGAFLNIASKTIKKMQQIYGTSSKDVQAWMGPSIKQCCYEIDGNTLQYAKKNFSFYLKNKHLDIRAIVQKQLEVLHVKIQNIEASCTCCNEEYFSYRRDGITGRNAGIIMLRSDNV